MIVDRRNLILQQMVLLCQDSLKCDTGNAVEFAAAFAKIYGDEMARLEKEILTELANGDGSHEGNAINARCIGLQT